VAPTDTQLLGPSGVRGVGGTSNAAPNAAGAAALMIAADRRAGLTTDAATIRARLDALALDLGAPGPDMAYGAGRVRATLDGPLITPDQPAPGAIVRGVVFARFGVVSPVPVVGSTVALDGTILVSRVGRGTPAVRLDTRALPDGVHRLQVSVRDMAGNTGTLRWAFRVDNTAPRVRLARVVPRRGPAPAGLRPVRLVLRVDDRGGARPVEVSVRRISAGGPQSARTVRMRPGTVRNVALGRVPRGRLTLRIEARDAAGNRHVVLRGAMVR
jgi:hypothetical protein